MEAQRIQETLQEQQFDSYFVDNASNRIFSKPAKEEIELQVREARRNLQRKCRQSSSLVGFLTASSADSKDATRRENERQLAQLSSASALAILVHGLSVPGFRYDGRKFMRLRKQLDSAGIHSIALEYDDRPPFTEYAQAIHSDIYALSKQVPCAQSIVCIGQSTGGDILRYIVSRLHLDVAGHIFAAPATNGKAPDIVDRYLFGSKAEYCNPKTTYGQEIIEALQRGTHKNGITLLSAKDAFIPMNSSIDTNGANLVVGGFGHLAQTGVNEKFNNIYISCIQALLRR